MFIICLHGESALKFFFERAKNRVETNIYDETGNLYTTGTPCMQALNRNVWQSADVLKCLNDDKLFPLLPSPPYCLLFAWMTGLFYRAIEFVHNVWLNTDCSLSNKNGKSRWFLRNARIIMIPACLPLTLWNIWQYRLVTGLQYGVPGVYELQWRHVTGGGGAQSSEMQDDYRGVIGKQYGVVWNRL